MIYADAAFRMGQTHEVCEDYAATGGHGDSVVVAVSDGCSSETDTDIGARALARSAVRLLSGSPAIEAPILERIVAAEAVRAVRAFDAAPKSCYATLMTITATLGGFRVLCWGDGIVGYRYRDGDADVTVVNIITWPNDQPYYPAYSLIGETEARPALTTVTLRDTEIAIEDHGDLSDVYWEQHLALADLVFVGSDGWSSFVEKGSRNAVPVDDVLRRLLPFRSSGPSFVRRRLGAFQRGLARTNWTHGDDLSLAAIHIKE